MTTARRTPSTVQPGTSTAGRVCAAGGFVGALQGTVLLVWPHEAGEERFSYPFTAVGHAVAEITFALQHLALLVGVLALLRITGPTSRVIRGGLVAAATGLALLVPVELWVATLGDAAVDDPRLELNGLLYGVPTLLIGAGLLVAGIGIARAGLWSGWRRWTTLAVGAYVFVVLLPLLDASFAIGRIVLGVWMLLFAALGLTLLRPPR